MWLGLPYPFQEKKKEKKRKSAPLLNRAGLKILFLSAHVFPAFLHFISFFLNNRFSTVTRRLGSGIKRRRREKG